MLNISETVQDTNSYNDSYNELLIGTYICPSQECHLNDLE